MMVDMGGKNVQCVSESTLILYSGVGDESLVRLENTKSPRWSQITEYPSYMAAKHDYHTRIRNIYKESIEINSTEGIYQQFGISIWISILVVESTVTVTWL